MRPKILLVENDLLISEQIRYILFKENCDVIDVVPTGEEAIEKAISENPDLILMDILLDGKLNGIETVEEIYKKINVPVIYITSDYEISTMERAKNTLPYGYLRKPISREELITSIQIALKKFETDDKLKISEQQFRLLLSNIKEYAIFMISLGGRILNWNEGAEKILGYKESEILGKNFSIFFGEDESASLYRFVISEKSVKDLGWKYKKNGDRFWGEVFVNALHDKKNILTGFAVVIKDMSEEKKIEEERKAIQEQLRRYNLDLENKVKERTRELEEVMLKLEESLKNEHDLNELKNKFVSMISHDFRNPITVIRANGELFLKFYERWSDEQRQNSVEKIIKASDRMDELVEEVLLISKIKDKKFHFSPQPVNLKALCEACLEHVMTHGNVKNNRFKFNYQSIENFTPKLDEKLMKHILDNLISNAVKYSFQETEIFLDVEINNEDIIIKIKNTGIGIPKQDIPNLFSPFFRSENVGTIKGMGIGLTSVKEFVDIHCGGVFAESQDGVTSFIVKIPKNNNYNSLA